MVEMVQQSRTEAAQRVAALEAQLAQAQQHQHGAAGAGVAGAGGDAEELREQLEDAVERAEAAESKRLAMQERINQLEQKLWAAEKALWDTEDKADETIKKLEARLIALQDAAATARPSEAAAAGEGGADVQLSEAQEKILVKVLKESKAKIKGKCSVRWYCLLLTPLQ